MIIIVIKANLYQYYINLQPLFSFNDNFQKPECNISFFLELLEALNTFPQDRHGFGNYVFVFHQYYLEFIVEDIEPEVEICII